MGRTIHDLEEARAAVLAMARELHTQGEHQPTSRQMAEALLYHLALSYAVDDLALLASEALRQQRPWWVRLRAWVQG